MKTYNWIKLQLDIFENWKMKSLAKMPNGNALQLLWIRLLCLAGSMGNGGVFLHGDQPITPSKLAIALGVQERLVLRALTAFEELNMISTANGVITILGWCEYQSLENKNKNVLKNTDVSVGSSKYFENQKNYSNNNIDIEKETETDKEKKKDLETDKETEEKCAKAATLYRNNCVSLLPLGRITSENKNELAATLENFDLKTVEEVFKRAESSDFLKGNNKRNWKAGFNWLIKKDNFLKVQKGTYDNRKPHSPPKPKAADYATYDMSLMNMIVNAD